VIVVTVVLILSLNLLIEETKLVVVTDLNFINRVIMSITILKRSSQGMRSVKLSNGFLYTIAFIALFLVSSVGVGAYYYALSPGGTTQVDQITVDSWKAEMKDQWGELEASKKSSQQQINALTARLGMIQAHVTRLDAVGERILSISGIDKKEFNFDLSPAIGGPQELTEALADQNNSGSFGNLDDAFSEVTLALDSREQQLRVLESLLMDKHMGVERYISGRPTTKGWLSSYYGERSDPFTGKPAWHAGIDFAGKEGDNVISTAAGVVSWVGDRSGYGLLVEINHGDGLVTRYGHNKLALVEKGQVVKKGQIISEMGNSGRSTGAHVHYEVIKNGRPINPTRYVNRKPR
jgi:murein DD-endopeptidase MepM/ murein hydrolase activator NlpD